MDNQQPRSICYLSYEHNFDGKLYIGFDSHCDDNYFGSFSDEEFKPTDRIKLYEGNSYIALLMEWSYQNCWQTENNPRFANKCLQTFDCQCSFILETKHGGNKHDLTTRKKISKTMKDKKLGTFNPEVRLKGNRVNRGRKNTEEQKLKIKAGQAWGFLKRNKFNGTSKKPLTKEQALILWNRIDKAQRLGLWSVPSSEGKCEIDLKVK